MEVCNRYRCSISGNLSKRYVLALAAHLKWGGVNVLALYVLKIGMRLKSRLNFSDED